VAAIAIALPAAAAAVDSIPARDRPEAVVKTIVALLALVGLAYLGGHPRVRAWEERLRISQVITAGFPFVLLGIAARQPGVEIVTDPVLADMGTLLAIALGWTGLAAGFRFDPRLLGGLPPGASRVVALATSIPFAFVLALTGLSLVSLSGARWDAALRDPAFLRDALLFGTAAAMTAKTGARLLRTDEAATTLSRVIRVEELAGVLGLAAVAAYFRPAGVASWQLPGTAWLLLTVGLGAAVGTLTYAILQRASAERPQFVVLSLGSVSFAAGCAACLHLSPLVVTFVAGVFLANFPGEYKARLGAALRRLERPAYLLFLFSVGALWEGGDWRAWVLMPVFTATRLIGKRVGATVAARGTPHLGADEREALSVAPIGPLAIAILVNAQLLYPGRSTALVASAVVGGALLTEVVVQLVARGKLPTVERRARQATPAPSREAAG
jgi:hypothetical protein